MCGIYAWFLFMHQYIHVYIWVWGGYDEWASLDYRSLLQDIVSFIGLFCKRFL